MDDGVRDDGVGFGTPRSQWNPLIVTMKQLDQSLRVRRMPPKLGMQLAKKWGMLWSGTAFVVVYAQS
ncbi:MAG: hypothetical protein QMB08_08710, partial [Acidimicrobiales bacterium]